MRKEKADYIDNMIIRFSFLLLLAPPPLPPALTSDQHQEGTNVGVQAEGGYLAGRSVSGRRLKALRGVDDLVLQPHVYYSSLLQLHNPDGDVEKD